MRLGSRLESDARLHLEFQAKFVGCPIHFRLALLPCCDPSPAQSGAGGTANMSAHTTSSTANVVGVHYRVGKKIGEGSFGVIFEGAFMLYVLASSQQSNYAGTNLLNSQTVAIKFVRSIRLVLVSVCCSRTLQLVRNQEKLKHPSCEMNAARTVSSTDAVSPPYCDRLGLK
jgi:hypothetical protein